MNTLPMLGGVFFLSFLLDNEYNLGVAFRACKVAYVVTMTVRALCSIVSINPHKPDSKLLAFGSAEEKCLKS